MPLPRMQTLIPLLVAACDGSSPNNPDPASTDASPLPVGCDFTERADPGNDDLSQFGMAEATGLTFLSSSTICGTIDTGHFDAINELVDLDSYAVTIGAPSQLLLRLTSERVGELKLVAVIVFDEGRNVVAAGSFLGTHLVFHAKLPAGSYTITMAALDDAALGAPIEYKLALVADDPVARCGTVTTAAHAAEAHDGAEHTGNDMVEVRFWGANEMRRVLTAADDAPEPTGITTTAGTKYRFSGSSAPVEAVDAYLDRDAFLFRTGPDTNQLSIRVDWAGTTVDVDYMVFPAAGQPREIVSAIAIGNTGPEFATFAVLPETDYWLWIGSYLGSTGLPIAYDASVCAEHFAP